MTNPSELRLTKTLAGAALLLAMVAWATAPRNITPSAFRDIGETFFPDFQDPNEAMTLEVIEFDPPGNSDLQFRLVKVGGAEGARGSAEWTQEFGEDCQFVLTEIPADTEGETWLENPGLRPGRQQTEQVTEIGPGLDAVELAAGQERDEDRVRAGAVIAPDENPVFPANGCYRQSSY